MTSHQLGTKDVLQGIGIQYRKISMERDFCWSWAEGIIGRK